MTEFTISELSENANVSYATVCRLLNKLNCRGYKDFKTDLKAAIRSSEEDSFEQKQLDMSRKYTTEEICEKVCNLSSAIIHDCHLTVNAGKIDAVVDMLLKAKSIYFIGMGMSAVSAHYAYTKLFRIGIPCAYDADSTIYKMKAATMGRNDVLFAISSSGRTRSVLDAVQIAKTNGSNILCVCDFAITPLTRLSDINLYTTARDAHKFLNYDFPLIAGQITIIDILYSCCFNMVHDNAQRYFDKTKFATDSEKVKPQS